MSGQNKLSNTKNYMQKANIPLILNSFLVLPPEAITVNSFFFYPSRKSLCIYMVYLYRCIRCVYNSFFLIKMNILYMLL